MKTKVIAFRIKTTDEAEVREWVRKFLIAKGYKLYDKTSNHNLPDIHTK